MQTIYVNLTVNKNYENFEPHPQRGKAPLLSGRPFSLTQDLETEKA